MTRVWREGDTIFLEAPLLEMFVTEQHLFAVLDRLGGDAREPEEADLDPFAEWERSLSIELDDQFEEDAFHRRLFPNAYPDDDRASADFRRYTADDQRQTKIREIKMIIAAIEESFGEQAPELSELTASQPVHVRIEPGEFDGWLRGLNALRILLATELNITDADDLDMLREIDDDDPRAISVGVMELVAMWQEILLHAHLATGDQPVGGYTDDDLDA